MAVEFEFDSEADAAYIRLSEKEVEETQKVDSKTILDRDSEGEIVGIEILDASNRFPEIAQLNINLGEELEA